MEYGRSDAGSDDRHEEAVDDSGSSHATEDYEAGNMKLSWDVPTVPASPTSPTSPTSPSGSSLKAQGHRRTLSGSILAKLNFLRPGSEDGRPGPRGKEAAIAAEDGPHLSPTKHESAMADALKHSKTVRKRKGSLRKTALLGGRRLMSEGRERRNSLLQRSPQKHAVQPVFPVTAPAVSSITDHSDNSLISDLPPTNVIKRQFSYESYNDTASSSSSTWSDPPAVTTARLALITDQASNKPASNTETTLSSPLDIKSPTSQTSQTSYASTNSDDEPLTFDHPAAAPTLPTSLRPDATSTSYFPTPPSSTSHPSSRSRSRTHRPSPLTHTPLPYPPSPPEEPYDYTETAYWGWVLLACTWIIFTVGMGSCLEVWSWAWDVGETPYAPPELEDDPTLPIVGYYPALIVLTGVVAWVWITVAWVGMKYFRHARVEV